MEMKRSEEGGRKGGDLLGARRDAGAHMHTEHIKCILKLCGEVEQQS